MHRSVGCHPVSVPHPQTFAHPTQTLAHPTQTLATLRDFAHPTQNKSPNQLGLAIQISGDI
ncbi:hypothetical protein D4764_04G0016070, partial [Takifugu flavidus]